jgi:hypothetical protein
MRNTRPAFWVFVPLLLAISVGAIWGTAHFGPIGKPSQAAIECSNVRQFVADEEELGRAKWIDYRTQVDQFLALSPTSPDRIPLIEEMASTVIEILGHDLAIYKELGEFSGCVLQSRRDEISGMIEETEATINFLNGSTPIDGTYFDPELGTWNTTYYEEFLSAMEFLKPGPQTDV